MSPPSVVLLPDRPLVQFADARLGDGIDEFEAFRHGEFRQPALVGERLHELLQFPGRDLAFVIRFQGDHHEGPFAPFLVFDADSGGFQDRLVLAQQVLQIQGGDPLPAALDHVLDAIGDLRLNPELFLQRRTISALKKERL